MEKRMSFLVFGVGAIGTYIGTSLAYHGNQVAFIDRPEVARQVREEGLELRVARGKYRVDSPLVTGTVEEAIGLRDYDAAILAVKSFDTPAVLESIRPFVNRFPPILCLQNGVENEILLRSVMGDDRVIPGSVTTAVQRLSAGQATVEKLRGIGISASHPMSPFLIAAFNHAGLGARGYTQADGMKWSKMLTNLLANASSAILDLPPVRIFAEADLYRIEIAMFKEALEVMRALDVSVIDLPATPVRVLSALIDGLPAWLSRPLLFQALGKGRGGKMPSFHIDLHAGRGKSEVEFLNGAVVRFGEKTGVHTPVNRWMTRVLLMLTRGELPVDTLAHDPQKYLDWLANDRP